MMADPLVHEDHYGTDWDHEGEDDEIYCRNGHPCEWEGCPNCGGEGYFDMHEDSPIEYAPGETVPCALCSGEGGWWRCLEVCGAPAQVG